MACPRSGSRLLHYGVLPTNWPLAFVALFEEDDVSAFAAPGSAVSIKISITDPKDEVLLIPQQNVPVGFREYADIPFRFQMSGQFLVLLNMAGDYTLRVLIDVDGQHVEAERKFYVRPPKGPGT